MDIELMTKWAAERVDRLAEDARKAQNLFRCAERDLEGIRSGRPSIACEKRFMDWSFMQPRKPPKSEPAK
jgi:hypothetical protein